MRRAKNREPRGFWVGVPKFIAAALFGCFISAVVYVAVAWGGSEVFFWETPLKHILWIIPLLWGILGVFWFDRMLETASGIFERFFRVDR